MYTHYDLYTLEDHRQPRFRMNKKIIIEENPKPKTKKKKYTK